MADSKKYLDLEGLGTLVTKIKAEDAKKLSTSLKGAKNGVASLDANGYVPLSQLGNIDTTFSEVVTALPTDITKIKKHLYLVKSTNTGDKNIYAEYVYTGEVGSGQTYDASKWEKLGEVQADVDLSAYSKSVDTVKTTTITQGSSDANLKLNVTKADGSATTTTNIPVATTSKNGVMSAADKAEFNSLLNSNFPFSVASFALASSCPAIQKVGSNPTFAVTYSFGNLSKYNVTSCYIAAASGTIMPSQTGNVNIGSATTSYTASEAMGEQTSHATYTYTLHAAGTHKITGTASGDKTKSITITFNHASYVGKVAADVTPSSSTLTSLTESLEGGRTKTSTQSLSNQKFVYCYPSYFGNLTSIKDSNGFEGIAGFTETTFTANGTTYNCYTQTIASTGSATYTFK